MHNDCKNVIQKMKHLWQGWVIFSLGPDRAVSDHGVVGLGFGGKKFGNC